MIELRRMAADAPEIGILADFILDSRRSIVR